MIALLGEASGGPNKDAAEGGFFNNNFKVVETCQKEDAS
jgi:hypothetical protein